MADSCLINTIKENNKTATGWMSQRQTDRQTPKMTEEEREGKTEFTDKERDNKEVKLQGEKGEKRNT